MTHRHCKIFRSFILSSAFISFLCLGNEYWQQEVDYEIEVKLYPGKHLLKGSQQIIYQNNSPDTLSKIYIHLNANGFQRGSVMEQEAKAASITLINSDEETAWIKIDALSAVTFSPYYREFQIKQSYNKDNTLLQINMSPPLAPGDRIELSLKFRTKIRRFNSHYNKSGYKGQLYEMSQWYPKVCVYDKNGWDASAQHFLGEFYGEFGKFKVTIDVPDSFIVAATGVVTAGDPGWQQVTVDSNGHLSSTKQPQRDKNTLRRTVTFYAENVHDFVWTTSPDYVYEGGFYKNIPIHAIYKKSSVPQWNKKAVNRAKQSLAWLEQRVGEYPYPQLTLCEGLTQGGMEYPMMTILEYTNLPLIFHETCHMYFHGALANNEHKDAWLDEGIVTYLTEIFKEENSLTNNKPLTPPLKIMALRKQFKPFCKPSDVALNSLYNYLYSRFEVPLATECYKLGTPYLYYYNVYAKPTKFFSILDYIVGRDNFNKILKIYYQKWKFKHVDRYALQTVCEEISKMDLNLFFDQWLNTTANIDYACRKKLSVPNKNKSWKTEIYIERLGKGILPVEIELITKSKEKIIKRWNGIEKKARLTFHTSSKVDTVRLDPGDKILDRNRLNNGDMGIKAFLYPKFPSMYYLPRNHYSVFFWPRLWYNEIDGTKLGINILGSYLNRYYVLRNYFYYNLESQQVDLKISYSIPWEEISKNLWRHVSIKKVEGRFEFNANLSFSLVNGFAQQPTHNFRGGFSHIQVFDENYSYRNYVIDNEIVNLYDWEKGNLNKFYFKYSINYDFLLPQQKVEFLWQASNSKWGSDFTYTLFSLTHKYETHKLGRNMKLRIRTFLGYSHTKNSHVPIQDLFWIAEGNPIQRFKHPYLRSPGSMPLWINYHFPGGGNLRGYFNKLSAGNSYLTADRLITTNVELFRRKIHSILPRQIRGWVMGIDLMLFFDAGRVRMSEGNEEFLFDAGFGFDIYKTILGRQHRLRFNFPVWLSQPNLDNNLPQESNWQFRWMMSFR